MADGTQTTFGIDFWLYDPSKQACETDTETVHVGRQPLAYKDEVDKVIVSWHWARIGVDDDSMRFDEDHLPDLVIVDEAHHARIRETGYGEGETQLFKLLKNIQELVPHIVLLTATPYQTDLLDYYSLLDILGIPDGFRKELEMHAGWALGEVHRRFSTWVRQLRSIHGFLHAYQLKHTYPILGNLETQPLQSSTIFYENIIRETGEVPHDVVLGTHPATLLSVRNYRSSLKELGYRFPEPIFSSPEITITDIQREFLKDIEEYVRDQLCHPEKALSTRTQLGLIRSLYRQRIVSSVKAAYDTLSRRQEKLSNLIRTGNIKHLKPDLTEEFDPCINDENDAMPNLSYAAKTTSIIDTIIDRARTEHHSIQRLLVKIEQSFIEEKGLVDPKMVRLRELLVEHINKGRKVLVFSRFTSTTAAIIDEIWNTLGNVGIGRFDGEQVGVYDTTAKKPILDECSRKDVVAHLNRGTIKVMVCSDAASEGLNLHAANVVINVDVPWNPSRLLQRFGRVDRLGQKAGEVHLINLYYPDSIEERMYRVLEDRRTDFRAVLGEVPEIMSRQQKKVIANLGSGFSPSVNITLEEIESKRSQYLHNQIVGTKTEGSERQSIKSLCHSLVQALTKSAESAGRKVTKLDDTTIEIDGKKISLDSLNDDFVSLGSEDLSDYENELVSYGDSLVLHQIEDEFEQPVCFVIKDGDDLIPLTSSEWPALFDFIFLNTAISIKNLKRFATSEVSDIVGYLRETESWLWPDHERMRCISPIYPEKPIMGEVRIGKELGHVLICR